MAISRLPQVGEAMVEWAVWYAIELGWRVFPVRRDNKKPYTEHGFKDASTDEAVIRAWWQQHPTANIGLAVPDGWVVVDVDAYHDGVTTLRHLETSYQPLPRTMQSNTGSGEGSAHYCYSAPLTATLPDNLAQGIDIRRQGHYIILPPSIHANGKRYLWECDYGPDDLGPQPAPDWLMAMLSQPSKRGNGHAAEDDVGPIFEGTREATLLRIGGKMLYAGKTAAEIHATMSQANLARCIPRYEPSVIDRLVRNLYKSDTRHKAEKAQLILAQKAPSAGLSPVHAPHEDYPPLPEACLFEDTLTNTAAPWLDAYCAYSEKWAPRATPGFHQAIGLWVLSTVAARRICVELGNPIYPVLFLSMVAESSQYTKTTAAANGYVMLRRAGLSFLLGPDRSTPQAMLRAMSGKVPQDYTQRSDEEKEGLHKRLAFAGQRGWYYEEWGGMLEQMRRTDSPMATFHELLRVLDDGKPEFSSETIQRGMERIEAPYLALLTSATPQDLAPFMRPGSRWWRDGFWPRFAFIVPEEGPRLDRRPQGFANPSGYLIERLHSWHTRLGIPTVTMKEKENSKGRQTGEWSAETSPLPCTVMHLPPATLEAYYVYNEALLQMDVEPELRSIYSRFHDKALRIAMLLASLEGHTEIPLAHWAYGQEVAERWRVMLHHIITTVGSYEPLSVDEHNEQRIERLLMEHGTMTMRDIRRRLRLDSGTIKRLIQNMDQADRVQAIKDGKSTHVMLPQEDEAPGNETTDTDHDVPF